MYKEAKKEARGRGQRAPSCRTYHRVWCWLLMSVMALTGCTTLGDGDGVRQADQLAKRKHYKALSELLTHPHTQVRGRALYHMVKSTSQSAHHELMQFLALASELWRQEVLVLLLASGREDARANLLLARFCRDLHIELRLSTLAELGHRHQLTPQLWACMMEGLGDANKAVARLAHLGLRRQGWHSLPHLYKALKQNKPNTAAAAIALLQEITVHPWKRRDRWLRWFQDGEATLFKLRHTGQWPKHKALLAKLLARRSPAIQREAIAILANIAPKEQGLSMLLALPTPPSPRAITLWGQRGGLYLKRLLQRQPARVTPAHIDAFGAWLMLGNQDLLLPYLTPTRPAHCRAALKALLRNTSHQHRATAAIIDALDKLAQTAPKALSRLALAILWQVGELRPGRTRAALMALQANPKTTSDTHLTALARWAAWRQDQEIILKLIKQLRESTDLRQSRERLAALGYIGHFTSVVPAATTAFALTMKHPHALRATSYQLLHTLPPRQRYTWLLLLAPKLAPPQWDHLLDHLLQARQPAATGAAVQRLLTIAMAATMPWPLRLKAARVATRYRITPLKQRVYGMLAKAPQEHHVALARLAAAWGLSKAQPMLRRYFRQATSVDARWQLAIARLQCGDAKALEWCQKRLQKAKGNAWHAPKELIRALLQPTPPKDPARRSFYAQGRKLLEQQQDKLRHLLSSPLAAYMLLQHLTKERAMLLLQRLKRRSEPQADKALAVAWLRSSPRRAWLQQLVSLAPDIAKQGLLMPLAWLLTQVRKTSTSVEQKKAVGMALLQLQLDQRINTTARQQVSRSLQPVPSGIQGWAKGHWQQQLIRMLGQLRSPRREAYTVIYSRLGDAYAGLAQREKATRAYLLSLWLSHDHEQQRRTSARLRKLLDSPVAGGTRAKAPPIRPSTQPMAPQQRASRPMPPQARPTTRPVLRNPAPRPVKATSRPAASPPSSPRRAPGPRSTTP